MKNFVATDTLAGFSIENILEAFLAGTNDGFMILDNKLSILHFNLNYNKFHQLHTDRNLIIGYSLLDLAPNNSMQEVIGYIKRALKGDIVKFTVKYPPVDGRTYWYDMEFHPLKNDMDKIIGVGVGDLEITEKEEKQKKLKRSEEILKMLIEN